MCRLNRTFGICIIGDYLQSDNVIKTLTSLGGVNINNLFGSNNSFVYYINPSNNVIENKRLDSCSNSDIIFTIDEFYKKYPFKVGERVKSVYGDWYTNIIEIKEIDYEIKYRITNAGKLYFQSKDRFEKCEQFDITIKDLENTKKILEYLKKEHNNSLVDTYDIILNDINKQIKIQKCYESK